MNRLKKLGLVSLVGAAFMMGANCGDKKEVVVKPRGKIHTIYGKIDFEIELYEGGYIIKWEEIKGKRVYVDAKSANYESLMTGQMYPRLWGGGGTASPWNYIFLDFKRDGTVDSIESFMITTWRDHANDPKLFKKADELLKFYKEYLENVRAEAEQKWNQKYKK